MKKYTINFHGQIYFPKISNNVALINNAKELESSLKKNGFYPAVVSVERLMFSKELDGRLLYRVQFNVVEDDSHKPTVTDIDQYLKRLDCRYKGKIVKYNF